MLSSVALRAGELLIAALVGGGVLVAVAFAGELWLRRMRDEAFVEFKS